MKTNLRINLLKLIGLLLITGLGLNSSSGGQTTTTFTYQGRLNVGTSGANGLYDFLFQAFDASSGGNSLSSQYSVGGIPVTNGLFYAPVDLGTAPYLAPFRWLQISVSTNGAGSYSTLNPRQQLTPAPAAIYANTAGTVTNGSIGSAQLQNNSITTAKIASGQVVKTLNGLTDNVSIAAGANVTLTTNLNSLQISAPAGGLALPYSGSVATGGDAFSVSNSLSGNYGQLGKSGSGVYGNGSGTDSSAVRGEAGSGAWGVFGTASERDGIFGSTTASGANGYAGVRGKVDTADGVGVRGNHVPSGNYGRLGTASYGVQGVAATAGSAAVDGPHIPSGHHGQLGTASEGAIGVHGPTGNYGQLGTANQGVYGASSASGGIGIRGDGFGAAWGLYGTSDSRDGVYGFDGASAPAGYAGVRGETTSANAAGVRGNHSNGNYGQLGTAYEGVLGVASGIGHTAVTANCPAGGMPFVGLTSGGFTGLSLFQLDAINPCQIYLATPATPGNGWAISMDSGATPALRFKLGGSDRMTIGPSGNIAATSFNPTSDRNAKENFGEVSPREVLAKVVALPISRWNFKQESSVEHIGPMAQDFYAAFGTGADDKHIATVDADGVALAAIQGLNQKLLDELTRRDAENAELKKRLEALEQMIRSHASQPLTR